jgi:enoyl-CoA hydratase
MAGASDVIFAAEGTRFGLPEIDVGVLGGVSRALRMLPLHKVRARSYTDEPIDAAEIYRQGAVEQVVVLEELPAVVERFALRIAEKDPQKLRFAKEAMNGVEHFDLERNYR